MEVLNELSLLFIFLLDNYFIPRMYYFELIFFRFLIRRILNFFFVNTIFVGSYYLTIIE